MKKTALYQEHLAKGAKMVDFFGFSMPLQYSSIIDEHMNVRKSAGIFDVSHMGEISVSGERAKDLLNYLCTNDISKISTGQIIYTPMCYKNGSTVDDLLVYCLEDNKYLLVVNASNIQKDYEWIIQNNIYSCKINNLSESYSQIALQGPLSSNVIKKLYPDINLPNFFKFITYDGMLISRTGYTGEDGFEIYLSNDFAPILWNKLLSWDPQKIKPIGLGARNTLRFEATLPLYGHELSNEITPIEAGLKRFVSLTKGTFIGKEKLEKEFKEGPSRTLVALEIKGKKVARENFKIFAANKKIGYVTSGLYSPYFKKSLCLGLIESKFANCEDIRIEIRKKLVPCIQVKKPFYKPNYKK